MRSLEPRPVEWHAPWRWSREALALVARRPATAVLGSAAVMSLFCLALGLEPLWLRLAIVLLLPALSLAGFMRLAAAADHSEPHAVAGWLPSNRETLRILLVAVLGYGAVAALLYASLRGQPVELSLSPLLQTGWIAWAARAVAFGAASIGFTALLLALRCWFLLPLTHYTALSLREAVLLGLDAYRRNRLALGLSNLLVLGLATLALILTLGTAALLLPPFLGALLYVSFREIFLGQRANAPARVTADAAAATA